MRDTDKDGKGQKNAALSFHTLPKDNRLQDEWRRVLKIEKSVSKSHVCSKHFKKEDYFFSRALTSQRHILKRGTIPSCCLPKTTLGIKEKSLLERDKARKLKKQQFRFSNKGIDDTSEKNSNETVSSEKLLDSHGRSCKISGLLFGSTQENIETKTEPDLDIEEPQIKSEVDDSDNRCCFEFVGITPNIDNFELGDIEIKAEPEIDSDHGCKDNSEFYGTPICGNCNKNISTSSLSLETNIEGVEMNNSVCVCINFTESGRKQQKCYICGYTTNYLSMLNRHMRRHTGEKPYHCSVCDFSTKQSGSLTIHMRKHSGEKPYKCTMCDYTAARMDLIKAHMRTHTVREKAFKCSECDYATTTLGHLKVHIRTHTGETPYKCTKCDYASNNSSGLKIHMLKHSGEMPHKCNMCDYASVKLCNLKFHMRTTHSGEKS